jgi:short-subunit dehydrogenase
MNSRALAALAIVLLWGFGLQGCATSTALTRGDPDRIAGRTYVVTGASSGFGRGAAVRLGGLGANVVLAARRTELLEEVASEVRAAGGAALVVTTDVTDPAAVERLADQAVARFGRVDVWINNAGVGAIGLFEDIPVADHSRLVDINLKGVIYGSHAAMRLFRSQGSGELVNVGSVDSEVPLAYQASYSATKAGVLALGRALNEEIRLNHAGSIHVSTVMPWAADTPWWPHAANYSDGTPRMAAMDDPREIVEAIVWVSVHPREELPVGWKAQLSNDMHHIMPDLTERLSGDVAHHWQIDTAPPAPPTHGTLYEPTPQGRDVDGGVRDRMRAENAARRRHGPQ